MRKFGVSLKLELMRSLVDGDKRRPVVILKQQVGLMRMDCWMEAL